MLILHRSLLRFLLKSVGDCGRISAFFFIVTSRSGNVNCKNYSLYHNFQLQKMHYHRQFTQQILFTESKIFVIYSGGGNRYTQVKESCSYTVHKPEKELTYLCPAKPPLENCWKHPVRVRNELRVSSCSCSSSLASHSCSYSIICPCGAGSTRSSSISRVWHWQTASSWASRTSPTCSAIRSCARTCSAFCATPSASSSSIIC